MNVSEILNFNGEHIHTIESHFSPNFDEREVGVSSQSLFVNVPSQQ